MATSTADAAKGSAATSGPATDPVLMAAGSGTEPRWSLWGEPEG